MLVFSEAHKSWRRSNDHPFQFEERWMSRKSLVFHEEWVTRPDQILSQESMFSFKMGAKMPDVNPYKWTICHPAWIFSIVGFKMCPQFACLSKHPKRGNLWIPKSTDFSPNSHEISLHAPRWGAYHSVSLTDFVNLGETLRGPTKNFPLRG